LKWQRSTTSGFKDNRKSEFVTKTQSNPILNTFFYILLIISSKIPSIIVDNQRTVLSILNSFEDIKSKFVCLKPTTLRALYGQKKKDCFTQITKGFKETRPISKVW